MNDTTATTKATETAAVTATIQCHGCPATIRLIEAQQDGWRRDSSGHWYCGPCEVRRDRLMADLDSGRFHPWEQYSY